MNTYSEYKELQMKQNKIVSELSDKHNKYSKGEFHTSVIFYLKL